MAILGRGDRPRVCDGTFIGARKLPAHALGMHKFLAFIPIALWAAAFGGHAADAPNRPIAVELFTSQGCSSCPPAEAFLRELADREDVVALEWHVDYWDRLVHGADGRWRDPFSDPAHTERQRRYNLTLRGTDGVYTPQMVIGGVREAVGSRRGEVEQIIADAPQPIGEVAFLNGEDDLVFRVSSDRPAQVLVAYFQEAVQTRVRGGENKGRDLWEANVVTEFQRLGMVEDQAVFETGRPAIGAGCAVLAQSPTTGEVIAASYCPAAPDASR